MFVRANFGRPLAREQGTKLEAMGIIAGLDESGVLRASVCT